MDTVMQHTAARSPDAPPWQIAATVLAVAEPESRGVTSRRRFLGQTASTAAGAALAKLTLPAVGAGLLAGGSGLLAACSTSVVAPTIVPLFSPSRVLAAGRPQRIPIGVVTPSAENSDTAVPNDDQALEIAITLDGETIEQASVAGRIVNHDHFGEDDPDHQHANIFRYYPLRANLQKPGIYDLLITVPDGGSDRTAETQMPIQIFDQADVKVFLPGDSFPSIVTPTFDAPSEIDRLCTRFETPCPFHHVTAAQVLESGQPMAVLVATPAFCSTAYCGPVLDTMVEGSAAFPNVEFIHLEVYSNIDQVGGNYDDPDVRLAPSVIDLGLDFEPSLFLVDAGGIIVDRIDNVFDQTELAEALAGLS